MPIPHIAKAHGIKPALAATIAVAALSACASHPGGARAQTADTNRAIVHTAFERWRRGEGGPFELLADHAEWTIVGSSPLSRTYHGRQQFLDEVIIPFNARLASPLKPDVRAVHADGDTVIAMFDGEAVARDGQGYRNTYCWCMQFENGRITKVTAFLDTRLLDEFWARVPVLAPAAQPTPGSTTLDVRTR